MPWEVPEEIWEETRGRVVAELRRVARRGDTMAYKRLVETVSGFDGPNSRALARMLGEINGEEAEYEGRPLLLSAVVIHSDEPYPGGGFFSAARHLGFDVPNDDLARRVFWSRELDRVHAAYGRAGDR